MPDILPVTTLPTYLGLEPARGSAGFCPVTFGSLWLGYQIYKYNINKFLTKFH